MTNNRDRPREYDGAAVLGGIEGIKLRLASADVKVRIAALSEALKYGKAGLDLVIQALDRDSSAQVRGAARILVCEQIDPKEISLNFYFLKAHDEQLFEIAYLAEKYFIDDFNTCLIKLRQFGEKLAQLIANKTQIFIPDDERQIERLNTLFESGILSYEYYQKFNTIREKGNDAVHKFVNDRAIAQHILYLSWELSVYYVQRFSQPSKVDELIFIEPSESKQVLFSRKVNQLSNIIKALDSLMVSKNALPEEIKEEKRKLDTKLKEIERCAHSRQIQQKQNRKFQIEHLQKKQDEINLELLRLELDIDDLQNFDCDSYIKNKLANLRQKKESLKHNLDESERQKKQVLIEPEFYTSQEKETRIQLNRQFQNLEKQYSEKLVNIDTQIKEKKANAGQLVKELASFKMMLPNDLIFSLDRHNIKLVY